MTSNGYEMHKIGNTLVQEAAALVWYARQDVEGERARLEAELADVEAEVERLEKQLPALQKARDEAKQFLDDLRSGKVEGAQTPGVLADAHKTWLEAGTAASNVGNPLSSLRFERKRLRDEIEALAEIERPETPLLDELMAILGQ